MKSSAVRLNRCAETLRPAIASADCNRLRLAFAAFVDVAPAPKGWRPLIKDNPILTLSLIERTLARYAADSMKLVPLLAVVLLAVSCASESKKIYSMSTPELKLRHTQLVEEVAQPPREKEKIEFELLRRWQDGDKAAYLPQFSL